MLVKWGLVIVVAKAISSRWDSDRYVFDKVTSKQKQQLIDVKVIDKELNTVIDKFVNQVAQKVNESFGETNHQSKLNNQKSDQDTQKDDKGTNDDDK